MGKECRKRWKSPLIILTLLFLFSFSMSGCGNSSKSDEPVVLTLWHVYGAQVDSPLNKIIDRFNDTYGKDEGIFVQVTSVSNTNTIHEAVLAAGRKEPGAAELPDIFVSYPKTVLSLPDPEILADYKDYFTGDELSKYLPEFIEEGMIGDKLLSFPVAKSTEILFVNKTLFDRFATETGADEKELSTWEGIFNMAKKYTKWTDEKTPEIKNDGKSFFVHDYHFNYFQVGCESLGEAFFRRNEKGGRLAFGPKFKKAFIPYSDAAISGGIWLREGYATEPLRTGEAIISMASSASVLYYEDVVTYENNISEPIEVAAYPAPVFEGGEKLVMQRGAGFCITKSSKEREEAAAKFIKWLTEPENNVEFVTKTGYLPVTKEAFAILPEYVKKLESPKYRSLYEAIAKTQKEYRFYTAPKLANYLDLEVRFEKNIRLELSRARQEYEAVADKLAIDNKFTKTSKKNEKERIMEDAFKNLKKIMN